MSALLVADAGAGAGLGHLSRTGAVAVALRARGMEVRCLAWGADGQLERDGVVWEPLPRSAAPPTHGVIVLDSYEVDRETATALAERGRLVLMHDRGPASDQAAIVVSAARRDGEASPRAPIRLFGLRYACLRPAFWGLPGREPRREVRRVLIATGAGDFAGAGAQLAAAARETLPDAEIALVRGPHASGATPPGVVVVERPATLLDELLAADIVLSAGGQTLLEAASAGTPAVAFALADNQRDQAEALAAAGAAVLVEPPPSPAPGEALVELAADPGRRAALARRSQELVDGFGALRVGFHVARLAREDGGGTP